MPSAGRAFRLPQQLDPEWDDAHAAQGDWKLIFDMQGQGQLYNLAHDPAELENLYGMPEVSRIEHGMLAELLAWTLRAQDPLPLPRRRYVMKTDPRNYWSPYRSERRGEGRRL